MRPILPARGRISYRRAAVVFHTRRQASISLRESRGRLLYGARLFTKAPISATRSLALGVLGGSCSCTRGLRPGLYCIVVVYFPRPMYNRTHGDGRMG